MRAPSSSNITRSIRTGTAVPLAKNLVGEVFPGRGKFLARAPHHGAASERLAALAVEFLGVRDGVDHLHLVLGLVHDRLHVVAAEAGCARPAPGEELTVHLRRHPLGEER